MSSAVKQIINQLSSLSEQDGQSMHPLFTSVNRLQLPQLQQLIRELSNVLCQPIQASSQLRTSILYLLKSMLTQGKYATYLLLNVYVFPWLLSTHCFASAHPLPQRAVLLLNQHNVSSSSNNLKNYQSLLIFVEEFVQFVRINIPFHPSSRFQIMCPLASEIETATRIKSHRFFNKKDKNSLKLYLQEATQNISSQLKKLQIFIRDRVKECVTDTSAYHDNLYLLISATQLADSYSISAIVQKLGSFFRTQHVMRAALITNDLMNTGDIECLKLVSQQCLPPLLQHLLPLDFVNKKILPQPNRVMDQISINKLIDYFYIWMEKAKAADLNIQLYQIAYGLVLQLKKPFRLNQQQQLKIFMANTIKMKSSNDKKRTFLKQSKSQAHQNALELLREFSYSVSKQKRQTQTAYPNVLDSLTLSQAMEPFSQSLLKSMAQRQQIRNKQQQDSVSFGRQLEGPPKKMFTVQRSSKRNQSKEGSLTFLGQSKSRLKNIRSSQKTIGLKGAMDTPSDFSSAWTNVQQSHKEIKVKEPFMPQVTSRQPFDMKRVKSQPKESSSFNSSQFSQKDNKQIQSIYGRQDKQQQKDVSGQFLYFEKQSDLKSQKKQKLEEQPSQQGSISFPDSLQHSQSQQILQYGIDQYARIPMTVRKPKFAFKQQQTQDSIHVALQTRPQRTPKRTSNQKAMYSQSPRISAFQQSLQLKKPSPLTSVTKPKQFAKKELKRSQQSSRIRQNSAQPHLISESGSLEQSRSEVPSKFGLAFKHKSQKDSIIQQIKQMHIERLPNREVQVADFKQLRHLQNELGNLQAEAQQYNKILLAKEKQLQKLERERNLRLEKDPYCLKKQNDLIKLMLKNKEAVKKSSPEKESALARQLKESSIKNSNTNLRDYNPEVLKLKLINTAGYSKEFKKHCITNRCILLSNELIQIGYSFKHKVVTLYFTLKHYCESLHINLIQNSVNFTDSIQRDFDKVYVGKQMKFKTEVMQTKDLDAFVPAILQLKLAYEHKMSVKNQKFSCVLPLIPYNIAKPLESAQGSSLFNSRKESTRPYITPLFNSSVDLIKKRKQYLLVVFPWGQFSEEDSIMTIYYEWKEGVQKIVLKLKERAFRIQGWGDPLEKGRELIESVINMLVDARQ